MAAPRASERMKRETPPWGALLLALAFAGVPFALEWMAEPPAALRVTSAEFGETMDSEAMRERSLPHRWVADCASCRTVWYRFRLQRAEPPREAHAVYLPAVGQNVAVYLNGRLLGQGGRFADPVARLGRRPLWVPAPSALWLPGENLLYVLVKAETARAGLMPAPLIGAESALVNAWRLRETLAVAVPQVLATAAVMLALVMGVLAYYRRRDRSYLAVATAAAAFSAFAFSTLVVEPPFDSRLWDAWLVLCGGALALAVGWLATTLAGAGRFSRLIVATLAVFAVAAPLAVWLAPGAALADGALRLVPIGLALVGLWLAMSGRRLGDGRLLWPGAVVAVLLSADLARSAALPEAIPALPWAMSALLGAMGWLAVVRFVETLNAAELLNVDLEALVRERTAELQAQFERVRELERREAIAAERERLMRDMHDGVGGHLVSMLAMIEADRRRPGELATVVRDALDDMRLMIDSLDPVDDDLNAVLAMFHDRLAPRLRASNVELHWNVELLPAVPGLTPARVLHVLRILQEAVTNALRHGRARTLWISASSGEEGVTIRVRDDGRGFEPGAAGGGRGLRNLQRRAAEIGAVLAIDSAPGRGATVAVTLPSI
jgi:signal transduction histidine kinase